MKGYFVGTISAKKVRRKQIINLQHKLCLCIAKQQQKEGIVNMYESKLMAQAFVISVSCGSGCTTSCSGSCSGSCSSYCSQNCGGSCTSDCMSSCTSDCSGGCRDSCTNLCGDSCQHACRIGNGSIVSNITW